MSNRTRLRSATTTNRNTDALTLGNSALVYRKGGPGPNVITRGYYYRMKKNLKVWAGIAASVSVAAFVGLVFFAPDGLGVRIGAWAQLTATIGSVLAAALAFFTADANLAQAKESRQAVAEATRPRLSLYVNPRTYGSEKEYTEKHKDTKTALQLNIRNQSQFNVEDCRIEWELGRTPKSREEVGPLFADPNPSRGTFSEHVSYSGELRSSAQVTLGVQDMFTESIVRVMLYYTSSFSNGEWVEVHYWKTQNTSENSDSSYWELTHSCDPPVWVPAET